MAYEILKDLREDADKTQMEIAEILQTSKQYYGQYEMGKHLLPLNHLITLAKYYKVSTDYILGLTEDPKPYSSRDRQDGQSPRSRQVSERHRARFATVTPTNGTKTAQSLQRSKRFFMFVIGKQRKGGCANRQALPPIFCKLYSYKLYLAKYSGNLSDFCPALTLQLVNEPITLYCGTQILLIVMQTQSEFIFMRVRTIFHSADFAQTRITFSRIQFVHL